MCPSDLSSCAIKVFQRQADFTVEDFALLKINMETMINCVHPFTKSSTMRNLIYFIYLCNTVKMTCL